MPRPTDKVAQTWAGGNAGPSLYGFWKVGINRKHPISKVFEVAYLGVAAPCACVPALIVGGQQGGEVEGLGLAQLVLSRQTWR